MDALIRRTRRLVNVNSLSVMQNAHLYVMLADPEDLFPETRARIRRMLENALASLSDGRPGNPSGAAAARGPGAE